MWTGYVLEELNKKLDSENQMKEVVAEYEKTISELISDKEKEKEDKKAAGWGRQTILPSISWIRDLDQNSPRVLGTKKIIST